MWIKSNGIDYFNFSTFNISILFFSRFALLKLRFVVYIQASYTTSNTAFEVLIIF